jgi:uncharacterized protein YijF (DUF1287 family)
MIRRHFLFALVFAASILGCNANPTPTLPTPTVAALPSQSAATPANRANPATMPQDTGTRIGLAAESQVGVTTIYDAQYTRLDYPGGDLPVERGACTDVIVRAFRAIGVDLQARVHEDMVKNFSVYPKDWGLHAPDANIDHRRVQNLTKYFDRMGKQVNGNADENFKPGDVVSWQLSGWMQHIGIVAVDLVPGTNRHYMIHNIGAGTQKEDVLRSFTIIAHHRW